MTWCCLAVVMFQVFFPAKTLKIGCFGDEPFFPFGKAYFQGKPDITDRLTMGSDLPMGPVKNPTSIWHLYLFMLRSATFFPFFLFLVWE